MRLDLPAPLIDPLAYLCVAVLILSLVTRHEWSCAAGPVWFQLRG